MRQEEMHDRAAALAAFLDEALVGEGLAPGFQVTLLDDDRHVTVAGGTDGLGATVTPTTLFATYCAIKPVLGLVVGALIDQGEISLDDAVADLTDGPPGITVGDLLAHRVDLGVLDGLVAVLEDRSITVHGLRRCTPQHLGPRHAAYSEFANWRLLGLALEAMTGEDLSTLAHRTVLEPLALADQVCLDRPRAGTVIGVNAGVTAPHQYVPLLAEHGGWFRWAHNPGIGGYQTTYGAARILQAYAISAAGPGLLRPETAATLLTSGPVHHDDLLDRTCAFGYGVCVDMTHWDVGAHLGPASIGHLGMMGMTTTVIDLTTGLTLAFHIAGYLDAETASTTIRPRLVDAAFGP